MPLSKAKQPPDKSQDPEVWEELDMCSRVPRAAAVPVSLLMFNDLLKKIKIKKIMKLNVFNLEK